MSSRQMCRGAFAAVASASLLVLGSACGSSQHLSGREQLRRLVSCLRERGARVEVRTPQNVPAYLRRTFTQGITARLIATANVPADQFGKRPFAGAAVLVKSENAARSLSKEWGEDNEQPEIRQSGFLVLQQSLDTSAPTANKAVHDCFAKA